MHQTVSEYDFAEAFRTMGRADSFSYEGLKALYEYISQYEEDTGSPYELDVIGVCCEYSEYDDLDDYNEQMSTEHTIDSLRDETMVIEIPRCDGFIVQDY